MNSDGDDDDFTGRLNAGLEFSRAGYSQTTYQRSGRQSIKKRSESIADEDMDFDEIQKNIAQYQRQLEDYLQNDHE